MIELEAYLRHAPGKVIELSSLFGGDPAVEAHRAAPSPADLGWQPAAPASLPLPGRKALPRSAAFLEAVKEKAGVVGCGALVGIGRPVRSWEAVRGSARSGRAAVMPGASVLGACAREGVMPGMEATGRT